MVSRVRIATALLTMTFGFCVAAHSQVRDQLPEEPPDSQAPGADSGRAAKSHTQESPEFTRIVNAVIARENQLVKTLETYSPRMEIYIQDLRVDQELGTAPVNDHYFLGRVQFRPNRTIAVHSLLPQPGAGARVLKDVRGTITRYFSLNYKPSTFYFSLVMDTQRFDRDHYNFNFVRREFLGDVRCLVFDVTPNPHVYRELFLFQRWEDGLFKGRIWVEDHDYNIVRFNGGFTPAPPGTTYFHFDSWRENVQPGLWLPVYAYSEEPGIKYGLSRTLSFRAQMRFWGYGLENPNHRSEMTRIEADAPSDVRDSSESGRDSSPVSGERQWQLQAQDNALERLQKAGLLAPPGDADKVMETVVSNLIATNHLDNLPAVHCRVLLTSTLESLAIGDTIVLSRGLVDVLPDEPSLAAMLAHELARIALQQTMDSDTSKWAFQDRLMIPDEDLLKYLKFKPGQRDEQAADAKAIEILRNSPYKDQLGKAGLFLRAMADTAPRTPQLFGAQLGDRLVQKDQVRRLTALMNSAPQLQRSKVDQIAALPLGARVKVDPWSDAADLMKSKPVALLSAREKMPFEIAPLLPYLTRLPPPPEQARR